MIKKSTLSVVAALFAFLAQARTGSQLLEFVENKGQWEGPFVYKVSGTNNDIFLQKNGFTFLLGAPANNDIREDYKRGQVKNGVLRYHAYRVVMEGAAANPAMEGSKPQSWYYNYFLGKDQAHWKSGIHPCMAVDYRSVYPGIDLHVSSQDENLKYEFIVAPGADAAHIRLRYEGTDGTSLKGGNLVLHTSVGDVEELKPVAYQYTADGNRVGVSCRYRLKNNVVSYDFPEGYDSARQLVIDPTVVFATFTGSTADNWGFTATYDAAGNFYAGGIVAANGFPVSTGAFQTTFSGPVGSLVPGDMAIIKYNPTGNTKIFATYCGGTGLDQPHSMIVDTGNHLIVAGRSFSSDYPVTAGAYDVSSNGESDIVVTKFNASGTALVGSTYVGGSGNDGVNIFQDESTFGSLKYNYGDDARSEVLVDRAGNIYMAAASNSTNFPVTSTAFQSSNAGNQDAVVFKLNSTLTALTWSTYIGGTNDDAGYVLALDTAQTHLYVGGGTVSSNFPATTGTWHTSYQGGSADGFLARFNNYGTYTLQNLTFVGTSNYDQVYGVQVDLENNVYAMGQSLGGTFPVTAGVYSNPNSSQFIIKMDSLLATDVYSTVFGSGDPNHTNISPVAFLVDTCQNVYISGWGGNLGIGTMSASIGTTTGMPVTTNAAQSTTDGFDFYFIVLSKNAQSLLYGSFFGRSSPTAFFGEHVDGGTSRFDRSGVVYQAICGGCGGSAGPPFPTTPGSFSTTNGSPNCNLAALKIAFQLGAVNATASANPSTKGCPPFTVNFQNASTNATAYDWDFGDGPGSGSTVATPTHTYNTAGVYTVRMVAVNPNACKTHDTVFLTIVVDTNHVQSDFTYQVLDSCGPYRAQFTNTSTYGSSPNAQSFTKFNWSFGDNTSSTAVNPGIHNYPDTGTYVVKLVMTDTTACNSPDTVEQIVRISGFRVKAGFNAPDSVCLAAGALLANTSQNASDVWWDFGDSLTSTAASPVHQYAHTGTYLVTLAANNPASCNKTDTVRQQIHIKSLPVASFVFSPIIPVPNTAIDFTNQSTNAVAYTWNFGDNTGSDDVSPSHQYRRSGNYTVCLTATSADGCLDTFCRTVDADVHPAVDVPTGFSPNGDGRNDILYVRGAAIETLSFKLFNRWGELVFETSNMSVGWDGTYKGKPQDMDAYAYVLDATFIDGTSLRKTGNVTLLR